MLTATLAFALLGCAHAPSANHASIQTNSDLPIASLPAQELLMRLAETLNQQTARIDMTMVRRLGSEVSEAEAAQPSFTKINTYPQNRNGIVAISYAREAVQIDQRAGISERLSITLQPMLVCIDMAAVHAAWKPRVEVRQFAPIRFAAGRLSAADGLHRDLAEQQRRGNGPIEMMVQVYEPKSLTHQTSFSFDHQYHKCARSVTLTTRYVL